MNGTDNAIMKMLKDPDAGFGAFIILVLVVVAAVVASVFA